MIVSSQLKALIGIALCSGSTIAGCPFKNGSRDLRGLPLNHAPIVRTLSSARAGDGGIPDGGYDAVKQDIIDILTVSQDFFPADFADTVGAHYGPLMIRLAWHCSGSYRITDGRGGCDGARIRHDPELSWEDNANLDKARKILEPIKKKYGSKLSWGDLIILAGNAAIESMGGPILGFCGGRIDDIDGSNSLVLGPSDEQEKLTPCVTNGDQGECSGNLGPTTVGLIYVNPAGHLGNPDPSGLIIEDIRSSFGKMGQNDTETIALIGGGHAFGKCHGACSEPPCGEGDMIGIGKNTHTSGFEGAWTTAPTTWTNQYFTNLFDFEWTNITGPGGHPQWEPTDGPDIIMLTSDIALIKDEGFKAISQEFADDITKLEEQFKHAWYKLTTADMGPVTRCLGDNIPPAQAFQSPLPKVDANSAAPDFIAIREAIQEIIEGDVSNRAAFIDVAYKCGSTFRETDYQGGCNGAFIRSNDSVSDAIETLTSVKDDFPEASLADIIVLAGQVALEDAGGNAMAFCGGRTDADDISGRDHIKPVIYDSRLSAAEKAKDAMSILGLTTRQGVALAGLPSGTDELDNSYFIELMEAYDAKNDPVTTVLDNSFFEGIADTKRTSLFATAGQELLNDDEFRSIISLYAANEDEFLSELASAWTYLMNADRFDGPRGNVCSGINTPTLSLETEAASDESSSTMKSSVLSSFMIALGVLIF